MLLNVISQTNKASGLTGTFAMAFLRHGPWDIFNSYEMMYMVLELTLIEKCQMKTCLKWLKISPCSNVEVYVFSDIIVGWQ